MAWNTLPLEIRSRLLLVDAIRERVGERVHYQQIPEPSVMPHVWFMRTGVDTDDLLLGDGPATDRYIVEIVSDVFDTELVDAIVATLKDMDGPLGDGVVFLTFVDDADDDYVFKSAESDHLFMHALRVSVYHDNEF
jgi:hypothetical protein